jgi:hypothetical protein
MAPGKRGKRADLMFEGVMIPKRTRSAKIAAKGITNEEDMGNFLTAIFSDTLKGEIVLPKPGVQTGTSSKMLNDVEHKLRQGLPVTIHSIGPKRRRSGKSKVTPPETKNGKQRP